MLPPTQYLCLSPPPPPPPPPFLSPRHNEYPDWQRLGSNYFNSVASPSVKVVSERDMCCEIRKPFPLSQPHVNLPICEVIRISRHFCFSSQQRNNLFSIDSSVNSTQEKNTFWRSHFTSFRVKIELSALASSLFITLCRLFLQIGCAS